MICSNATSGMSRMARRGPTAYVLAMFRELRRIFIAFYIVSVKFDPLFICPAFLVKLKVVKCTVVAEAGPLMP